MSKWKDVSKGDTVKMNGREARVVKIKPKGKKARVMLDVRGRYSEGVVKLADKIKIVSTKAERDKLTDAEGTQQRWATKRELDEAMAPLPAGTTKHPTPPRPAEGGPWETPADRMEKKLDQILGARLVGQTVAEGVYCPPVDVTTVASHLVIYHGGIPDACEDEASMLRAHEAQHAEVVRGTPLAVEHWHTEKRP